MICKNCGTEVDDNAEVCPKCQSKINDNTEPVSFYTMDNKKGVLISILGIISAICIIMIVAIYLFSLIATAVTYFLLQNSIIEFISAFMGLGFMTSSIFCGVLLLTSLFRKDKNITIFCIIFLLLNLLNWYIIMPSLDL